jgi:hypothetical protein
MGINIINGYLQIISHIVTILGLPLAFYSFYYERNKERKEENMVYLMRWMISIFIL